MSQASHQHGSARSRGRRTAPRAPNCRRCSSVVSTMPAAHGPLPEACAIAARRPLLPAVTAGSMPPGATSTRGTCGTLRSRCRQTAAARFPRPSVSARTTGCSTDVPRTGRRWRSTIASVSTSSGRRWCREQQERADARAVLRDVVGRPALHDAGSECRPRASLAIRKSRWDRVETITVAWDEQAGGTRRVAVARGTARSRRRRPACPADDGRCRTRGVSRPWSGRRRNARRVDQWAERDRP